MSPRQKFDRYMLALGAGRNRKFLRFTDSERCAHFLGVLALAAQHNPRGYLTELDPLEISNEAGGGVTLKVAASAVEKLKKRGILIWDESVSAWYVHDWDEINPTPGAERTRRWRDGSGDVSVTPTRHAKRHNGVTGTSPEVKKLEVEVKPSTSSVVLSSSGRSASDELKKQREKASVEDRRLCRLLADLAVERNPKFKVKSDTAWLRDMRLSREKDGNEPPETEKLIRWVFAAKSRDASFWADTIQSPANLREHFGQVWGRMQSESRGGNVVALGHKQNASDLIRKLQESEAS